MDIVCYRNTELQRESRNLPAETYNSALLLLEGNPDGVIFIPIRTMQYLAIMDHEEIIFLDSENKSWVEIAWQNFRPQQRISLNDPVPYEVVYYSMNSAEIMKRLQGEFASALRAFATKKTPPNTSARIIKLGNRKPAC